MHVQGVVGTTTHDDHMGCKSVDANAATLMSVTPWGMPSMTVTSCQSAWSVKGVAHVGVWTGGV